MKKNSHFFYCLLPKVWFKLKLCLCAEQDWNDETWQCAHPGNQISPGSRHSCVLAPCPDFVKVKRIRYTHHNTLWSMYTFLHLPGSTPSGYILPICQQGLFNCFCLFAGYSSSCSSVSCNTWVCRVMSVSPVSWLSLESSGSWLPLVTVPAFSLHMYSTSANHVLIWFSEFRF